MCTPTMNPMKTRSFAKVHLIWSPVAKQTPHANEAIWNTGSFVLYALLEKRLFQCWFFPNSQITLL